MVKLSNCIHVTTINTYQLYNNGEQWNKYMCVLWTDALFFDVSTCSKCYINPVLIIRHNNVVFNPVILPICTHSFYERTRIIVQSKKVCYRSAVKHQHWTNTNKWIQLLHTWKKQTFVIFLSFFYLCLTKHSCCFFEILLFNILWTIDNRITSYAHTYH